MGKHRSKKIGAPIGAIVETPEVEKTVEVRTSTPELDGFYKDPPGDYEAGLTPEYTPGHSPSFDFQSGGENREGARENEIVDPKKDTPEPAPRAPALKVERSGPLVPSMVPGYEHLEKKPKSSRPKSERLSAPVATPESTLNRPRLDPEDLSSIQQAINSRYNTSIQESDNRSMTLTMQTQLANVLGTVQQIQTQVIRLASQCNDTHSRVIALENLSRHGFEQIGAKVGSAWTSQSKNRKAIEENNATIGDVARDLTEVKGTLRDVVRRMEPGAIVAHQVQDPWG
ncbi:hypothetical protein CAEBREN_09572 [Caenorhabditis brenneri]|uniref:Uncharacterized protein n=1 Tax=Caenorhabditis brenneri TaxID=135651 RepID=G0N434_CAEBE|nr:hypothetical protein CAEBREN_09572 [Caenorhabditis brenneri]